ncbi:hypothetical protein E2C01_064314 [Portunus trituberculatus]|uniref:Uncharacterized protein n=1 Tax=Portunus trituberculatus TaxID=210409 RepID=A0A5B7HJE5_PORTR|nr:hypothetical protein [Portunus trituberculatus]
MKVLRCLCSTSSKSWLASRASGVPPLVSTTARCTAWASDTMEAHIPLPAVKMKETTVMDRNTFTNFKVKGQRSGNCNK